MKTELSEAQQLISEHSTSCLKEFCQWPDSLIEMGNYTLGGGKCIRPALTYWTYKKLTKSKSIPLPLIQATVALEMIHSYSLIHDDLPCMDDDSERREKPSSHIKFGEGQAVLAGDALLTGAFEVLSHIDLDADNKVKLIQFLASRSGGFGMIHGQLLDIESENKSLNKDDIDTIHLKKTGALFECASYFAAIFAQKKTQSTTIDEFKIARWGLELGLLFQIIDDKLDESLYFSILNSDQASSSIEQICSKLINDSSAWWDVNETSTLIEYFQNRKN